MREFIASEETQKRLPKSDLPHGVHFAETLIPPRRFADGTQLNADSDIGAADLFAMEIQP